MKNNDMKLGGVKFIPRDGGGMFMVTEGKTTEVEIEHDDRIAIMSESLKIGAELQARRQTLVDMVEIQGRSGNYDYNDYMLGMYNGMELALAIMENREPNYKEMNEKLENAIERKMSDDTNE